MASFGLEAINVNSTRTHLHGRKCSICPQRILVDDRVLVMRDRNSYVDNIGYAHEACILQLFADAPLADVDRQIDNIRKHYLKTGMAIGVR